MSNQSNYDANLFTYHSDSKFFICEASTLGFAPGKFPKHIMLKGSSKKVLYVRDDSKSESDVIVYVPTKNSLEWIPGCHGTTLRIINS